MVSNATGLTFRFKHQLDDIISVAFKDDGPSQLVKYKKYVLNLDGRNLRSKLGDYRWSRDAPCTIRLFCWDVESWQDSFVTLLHEASHHVDYMQRGTSNHDAHFYEIHKKLLFAAFDMGILTKDDVLNSKTLAQNRAKIARLISAYQPHPVPYKQAVKRIHVYNSFAQKEQLSSNGYRWNGIDKAWEREISAEQAEAEGKYIQTLGIAAVNILFTDGPAITTRVRKNVTLFKVPYDYRDIPKHYGYRWSGKPNLTWEKKIVEDSLPADELSRLNSIPGIKIRIC